MKDVAMLDVRLTSSQLKKRLRGEEPPKPPGNKESAKAAVTIITPKVKNVSAYGFALRKPDARMSEPHRMPMKSAKADKRDINGVRNRYPFGKSIEAIQPGNGIIVPYMT
jgi:hypothetical protein